MSPSGARCRAVRPGTGKGSRCKRFGAWLEDCGQQKGQSAQSESTRDAQDEPQSSQSRTVPRESAPEPQRRDAGADETPPTVQRLRWWGGVLRWWSCGDSNPGPSHCESVRTRSRRGAPALLVLHRVLGVIDGSAAGGTGGHALLQRSSVLLEVPGPHEPVPYPLDHGREDARPSTSTPRTHRTPRKPKHSCGRALAQVARISEVLHPVHCDATSTCPYGLGRARWQPLKGWAFAVKQGSQLNIDHSCLTGQSSERAAWARSPAASYDHVKRCLSANP
jgi:hypothetical protein